MREPGADVPPEKKWKANHELRRGARNRLRNVASLQEKTPPPNDKECLESPPETCSVAIEGRVSPRTYGCTKINTSAHYTVTRNVSSTKCRCAQRALESETSEQERSRDLDPGVAYMCGFKESAARAKWQAWASIVDGV